MQRAAGRGPGQQGADSRTRRMFKDVARVQLLKSRQALWHSVWPGVTIPGTNVGDSDGSALLNGWASSDASQKKDSGLGIFGNSDAINDTYPAGGGNQARPISVCVATPGHKCTG